MYLENPAYNTRGSACEPHSDGFGGASKTLAPASVGRQRLYRGSEVPDHGTPYPSLSVSGSGQPGKLNQRASLGFIGPSGPVLRQTHPRANRLARDVASTIEIGTQGDPPENGNQGPTRAAPRAVGCAGWSVAAQWCDGGQRPSGSRHRSNYVVHDSDHLHGSVILGREVAKAGDAMGRRCPDREGWLPFADRAALSTQPSCRGFPRSTGQNRAPVTPRQS